MNIVSNPLLIALAAGALLATGCAKKQVAAAPPPAPGQSASAASASNSKPASQQPMRAGNSRQTSTSTKPFSSYPNAATRARIDQLLAKIEDAYFDYDRAALRADATKALASDSAELRGILRDYPEYKLTIEGHCDERGSAEYNMALGDKRAAAAKEYLVNVGIPSPQLNLVSMGKERQICEEHDEACWQRNRRVHIVAMAQAR
jgi:peptidoglycan-associated lipoprotein